MDEQIFLPENINFNLSNTKTEKRTIIYAVVYFKGRQYKINTGVKVFPSQWNKTKQIAIISNCYSKLDNANNKIANEKINIIYERFNTFKKYICDVPNLENEFYEVLKNKLNRDMKSRRNTKRTSFESDFKGLVFELSENRRSKYAKIIDEIITLMKEKSIPLEWESITIDLLYEYACSLSKNNDLQLRTYNDKIADTYSILNLADGQGYLVGYDKQRWNKRFRKLKETRNEDEKQSVNVVLAKETVLSLFDYNFETNIENEVKDIFVFLCLTGLAEGELPKIWNKNFVKWNNNNIELYRNKTGVHAIVPLADSRVKHIYEKYKNGFPYTKIKGKLCKDGKLKLSSNEIGLLNRVLHKIFKYKPFEKEILVTRTFVNFKDGKITTEKRKETVFLSDSINVYDSRHTFITMAYYDGLDKELIKAIVGHTSDKMIDNIYLKRNKERDIARNMESINAHFANVKNPHKQQEINTISQTQNVSLSAYEEKIIENHELKKQLSESHRESALLKDKILFNDVFSIDDYTDYVGLRAMEADQDCIHNGEKP